MNPRPFTLADLSQVLYLEEKNQVIPWTEEVFKQCYAAGYSAWVLTQQEKIMGFIVISVQGGEAHILNLCIDRECQKQGYGTQLLTYSLTQAKAQQAQIAYLEVRSSNSRAIRLYQKMGFIQIGVRKDYYPVPTGHEDALVLAKDLGL